MDAAGHAGDLLGQAIRTRRITRDSLFITSRVSLEHLNYDDVLRCCENSLRRLVVSNFKKIILYKSCDFTLPMLYSLCS